MVNYWFKVQGVGLGILETWDIIILNPVLGRLKKSISFTYFPTKDWFKKEISIRLENLFHWPYFFSLEVLLLFLLLKFNGGGVIRIEVLKGPGIY